MFFDNDVKGFAPHDAMALIAKVSGPNTHPVAGRDGP